MISYRLSLFPLYYLYYDIIPYTQPAEMEALVNHVSWLGKLRRPVKPIHVHTSKEKSNRVAQWRGHEIRAMGTDWHVCIVMSIADCLCRSCCPESWEREDAEKRKKKTENREQRKEEEITVQTHRWPLTLDSWDCMRHWMIGAGCSSRKWLDWCHLLEHG